MNKKMKTKIIIALIGALPTTLLILTQAPSKEYQPLKKESSPRHQETPPSHEPENIPRTRKSEYKNGNIKNCKNDKKSNGIVKEVIVDTTVGTAIGCALGGIASILVLGADLGLFVTSGCAAGAATGGLYSATKDSKDTVQECKKDE